VGVKVGVAGAAVGVISCCTVTETDGVTVGVEVGVGVGTGVDVGVGAGVGVGVGAGVGVATGVSSDTILRFALFSPAVIRNSPTGTPLVLSFS